jgi:hypothetical protein
MRVKSDQNMRGNSKYGSRRVILDQNSVKREKSTKWHRFCPKN